jgi:hypothetical protein
LQVLTRVITPSPSRISRISSPVPYTRIVFSARAERPLRDPLHSWLSAIRPLGNPHESTLERSHSSNGRNRSYAAAGRTFFRTGVHFHVHLQRPMSLRGGVLLQQFGQFHGIQGLHCIQIFEFFEEYVRGTRVGGCGCVCVGGFTAEYCEYYREASSPCWTAESR